MMGLTKLTDDYISFSWECQLCHLMQPAYIPVPTCFPTQCMSHILVVMDLTICHSDICHFIHGPYHLRYDNKNTGISTIPGVALIAVFHKITRHMLVILQDWGLILFGYDWMMNLFTKINAQKCRWKYLKPTCRYSIICIVNMSHINTTGLYLLYNVHLESKCFIQTFWVWKYLILY